DGAESNMNVLLDDVFSHRMGGGQIDAYSKMMIQSWVERLPLLPQSPPANPEAVARGKQVFEDPNGGACLGCHNGKHLTNNLNANVGTGGAFQVPGLVGVAWRAPFLH